MVRTRFAPSPTGYLHIGGVRTALFNWLYARQHQGQFILRIDDTDQERNVEEALQPILDGFRWLGIDWDEGPDVGGSCAPYFQSQRASHYQQAVDQLLAAGYAYRDYSTAEEYQVERGAAEKEKRPFQYSRSWMAENDEQAAAFEAEGRSYVVRLKMPRSGSCQFHDHIRGQMEFDWAGEQDHVIRRAGGGFIYHLANVVDDNDFRISHVIRGVEHLSNTPRQIYIAQGLGYDIPQYAHLPYVAEPGGTGKLSKRKLDSYLKNREFKKLFDHGREIAEKIQLDPDSDSFNPVLVDFYRDVGYLPAAIINYLVLLGWSLDDRTEELTTSEMIEHFSFERVNKAPASFDPLKLSAFQSRHMLAYPIKQKVALVLPFLQQAGFVESPPPCDTAPLLTAILEAASDRVRVAGDILDYTDFFTAEEDLPYDEKAFEKRLRKPPEAAGLLAKFRDELAAVDPFNRETTETCLKAFVESEGIKIGQIIHAVRVALTGKAVGFGLFETLEILGRERSLARMDRALSQLAVS